MIRFEKYHGIGNDFIVIEADAPDAISVEHAMRLCDRHFGIGGDGVLVVSPAQDPAARARMSVINADGSRPEMCGNGLRCVALHLAKNKNETAAAFLVETDAGTLGCDVERTSTSGRVGTEIGRGSPLGSMNYELDGVSYAFHRLATGNPHAVCFRPPVDGSLLDRIGPAVSGQIEGGANVSIATVNSPTDIDLAVWERGVGRTLACGTGAAATVIAATWNQLCPVGQPVHVHLPGGPLEIRVSEESTAYLKGPAEWVYSGQTAL